MIGLKPEKAPDAFLSLPDPQGGEGEEGRISESFHEYPRRKRFTISSRRSSYEPKRRPDRVLFRYIGLKTGRRSKWERGRLA